MTPIAKEVGYRIRKIRESKDFNQQQIADKLEITAGAYAKIERGETDPSISRLFEIAQIFKVDIITLVQDPSAKVSGDIHSQINTLIKDIDTLKKEVAVLKKSNPKNN